MTTQEFKGLNGTKQNSYLRMRGLDKDQISYAKLIVTNFGVELEDAIWRAKNEYNAFGI